MPGLFEVQEGAKSADMHDFPFTVARRQPRRTSLGIFEKAKGESYCNITRLSLRCAEKDGLNNVDSHIFQKLVEFMPVKSSSWDRGGTWTQLLRNFKGT